MIRLATNRGAVFAIQRDIEHAGFEFLRHLGLQRQAFTHAHLDSAVMVAHRQARRSRLGTEQNVARMAHCLQEVRHPGLFVLQFL